MAGVAFERVQLVRNKQNHKATRFQNTKAFFQYLFVAAGVFENLNHRDEVKAPRGEGKILSDRRDTRNGLPELLQIGYLKVNAANECRSARQFGRVATVAASEVEHALAF